MNSISNVIIPLITLLIILYGLYKKVNIFDEFIVGVKEGLSMSLTIFPTMSAMILGVNILLKSNVLMDFVQLIKPIFNLLKLPIEIVPLAILRPISGSSSLMVLNNLLSVYGADSYIGRVASVIHSSTDTTIYIIGLYFSAVGIKKIRYSLVVGLITDFICVVIANIVVAMLF